MRLYTIQPLIVYDSLMSGKSWTADPFQKPDAEDFFDEHFQVAYDWLTAQMHQRGILPQDSKTEYPVWTWYHWFGAKRPKPDLRFTDVRQYAESGTQVLLTLDVAEERVLLSDFDAWHWVLNKWHFGTEQDGDAFEERCQKVEAGYREGAKLKDDKLQAELEATWQQIFDMEKSREFVGRKSGENYIQGVLWEINPDDVVAAVKFDKKGHVQKLSTPHAQHFKRAA